MHNLIYNHDLHLFMSPVDTPNCPAVPVYGVKNQCDVQGPDAFGKCDVQGPVFFMANLAKEKI